MSAYVIDATNPAEPNDDRPASYLGIEMLTQLLRWLHNGVLLLLDNVLLMSGLSKVILQQVKDLLYGI